MSGRQPLLAAEVVGAAVRRLRADAGVTLTVVDVELGLCRGSWRRREAGKVRLGAAELFAFCVVAGCTVEDVRVEALLRSQRYVGPDIRARTDRETAAAYRAQIAELERKLERAQSARQQELDW